MKANSIDRVVVSKTNPHNNNTLWIDTSNGEKNAVLKYKGNPLVGGSGSGSGSDSDYQSSGSIVKDMVEQGSNFNWAKYAIDIPSLPCFKPEAEWPHDNNPISLIADGYLAGGDTTLGFVVKVTGENPGVEYDDVTPDVESEKDRYTFVDCEPIKLVDISSRRDSEEFSNCIVPIRTISWGGEGVYEYTLEAFGTKERVSNAWWFYPDYDTGYLKGAFGG